jgi:hypothetical protein
LTLIDEFTKESLAIDVAGTIRSTRVVKVLKEVIAYSNHDGPSGKTALEQRP